MIEIVEVKLDRRQYPNRIARINVDRKYVDVYKPYQFPFIQFTVDGHTGVSSDEFPLYVEKYVDIRWWDIYDNFVVKLVLSNECYSRKRRTRWYYIYVDSYEELVVFGSPSNVYGFYALDNDHNLAFVHHSGLVTYNVTAKANQLVEFSKPIVYAAGNVTITPSSPPVRIFLLLDDDCGLGYL